MPQRGPIPPNRSKVLYDSLFGGDRSGALETIANGIATIGENVASLLSDAQLLADSERYERAEFLATTAEEELGKLYILVDMCRLDFARHESVLRGLCKAFYDHVAKHAYVELNAQTYPGITNLAEMKEAYRIETQLWWPSDYESGEPDMPSDVYFYREANLYVNFDDYAKVWSIPKIPSKAMLFENPFLGTPVSKAEKVMKKIEHTHALGLFEPDRLGILNDHFSHRFINDRTEMDDLLGLYRSVGADLESQFGLPIERFEASEVHNMPLYAFL